MSENIEQPVLLTSDGAQLVGMHHRSSNSKVVLMCHGFKGNKSENKRLFVETARAFASEGLSAMRFDFYGSGDSEGDFADTTLSRNIANIKDAIQWAQDQGYSDIALLGISMGAAAAIFAAQGSPVKALVLWSTVPDMKELFIDRLGPIEQIPSDKEIVEHDGWLIKAHFLQDGLGYDIKNMLSTLTMPRFIVQGTQDDKLFLDGFEAFKLEVLPPADFMEIAQAGHTFQTPGHRRQVIRQTCIWLNRHF